ncbi:MAG TPA: hypothetical protein DCL63_02245 [Firmicutes bacterium]|nr:hypothetical protein [Bacillota bacterium]
MRAIVKRAATVACLFIALCAVFSPASYAARPTVIKVAHDLSPDPYDPTHGFAMVFKNYVESRTDGKYVVEIYPSSVLGKERERLELTRAGAIHVNLASVGGLSQLYQPAILLNTPFMYKSDKIVSAVLDSDFVQWMFADMQKKTGLRSICVYEMGGLSCITNNLRPIRKPADMKGIKFRAMDDSQVAMFKALGANAVPMAWSETYTGLQTGVVQGQVNPVSAIISVKLYEVQKHITLSRTLLGSHWVVVNDRWYGSLPKDVRQVVEEGFYYAREAAAGLTQIVQAQGLETLKNNGMEITALTDAEWAQFAKLGCPAVVQWAKTKMDPAIVDRFVSTVEKVEKQVEGK